MADVSPPLALRCDDQRSRRSRTGRPATRDDCRAATAACRRDSGGACPRRPGWRRSSRSARRQCGMADDDLPPADPVAERVLAKVAGERPVPETAGSGRDSARMIAGPPGPGEASRERCPGRAPAALAARRPSGRAPRKHRQCASAHVQDRRPSRRPAAQRLERRDLGLVDDEPDRDRSAPDVDQAVAVDREVAERMGRRGGRRIANSRATAASRAAACAITTPPASRRRRDAGPAGSRTRVHRQRVREVADGRRPRSCPAPPRCAAVEQEARILGAQRQRPVRRRLSAASSRPARYERPAERVPDGDAVRGRRRPTGRGATAVGDDHRRGRPRTAPARRRRRRRWPRTAAPRRAPARTRAAPPRAGPRPADVAEAITYAGSG